MERNAISKVYKTAADNDGETRKRLSCFPAAPMRLVLLALFLGLLCGCFQTKDELTLEADGSGQVRLETRTSVPAEMLGSMGLPMGMREVPLIYPPTSEAEAKRFFPAKDFSVTVKEERARQGEQVIVVEASFKDVNRLLASPYARAHALTLDIGEGKLVLKGRSGFEAVARFSDVKEGGGMFGAGVPVATELQKMKDQLRSEFRVTLPNAIVAANGTREGKTVAWIAERAKFTNATDFARRLATLLEASCLAEGLKMAPVTPPRIGLLPFDQLQAGAATEKSAAPDAKKIEAAARFVPYALQMTRSLDLSGEGGSHENQAQLIGAVVLPREFKPQKWSEAKLEEAIDAKGNSLKMDEGRHFSGWRTYGGLDDESDPDGENNEKSGGGAEERKLVMLRFQPPDWKVKEIARIKASVSLQYLGGSEHVIKLTNAIPANWIKDVSSRMDTDFDASARPLNDSMLPELGLTLSFQMGMAQTGFTLLMLQVSGDKAVLSEAQVFDAQGQPWPTFVRQPGDETGCWIVVAGRPTAPLSLALVASGVGANVEIPILLERIPAGEKTSN